MPMRVTVFSSWLSAEVCYWVIRVVAISRCTSKATELLWKKWLLKCTMLCRKRCISCVKVWLFHFYPQDSALWGGSSVQSCQVPVEAGDTAGRVSATRKCCTHIQQTSRFTNIHQQTRTSTLSDRHTHVTHTHRLVLFVQTNTSHMCCQFCWGFLTEQRAWIGSTYCTVGSRVVHV